MINMHAAAFPMHIALQLDAAPATDVGPGCVRRDLPAHPGVRVWVVDMAPGSQWPYVDHHPTGEGFFVVSGEVIEGDRHHRAGTYVNFAPGSQHRPRTDIGVRLFGFNLIGCAA
ncbi:MAG: cupin domain-containing protein [Lysobacter sp.]